MRQLRPEAMEWKDWLGIIHRIIPVACRKDLNLLAGEGVGNREYFSEVLTRLGKRAIGTTRFAEDAARLVELQFRFTAAAMRAYEARKRSLGVVDFGDMEQVLNEALTRPEFRRRLLGRFRVLLVDEYQDTSPMQLSIFTRLIGIIGSGSAPGHPCRAVYVGDKKQSIYGFNGARPALIDASTNDGGWKPENLGKCRRTVPQIMDFTNEFFSHLDDRYASELIEGDRLAVESARPAEDAPESPLRFWLSEAEQNSNGKISHAKKAADIAAGIAELVLSAPMIRPAKQEKKEPRWGAPSVLDAMRGKAARQAEDVDESGKRPLRYGDIAVLCRTNKGCGTIADALARLGIPAEFAREGFLKCREVRLCLACFRMALDRDDVFYQAEAASILGLDWFGYADDREKSISSILPFSGRLEALRTRLAVMTPAELLDAVISEAGIIRIASQWNRPEERLANIEILRGRAVEYVNAMHSRRQAATFHSWLDWLDTARDEQAAAHGDAAQVWPYHEAKGREKP
ncbi:MAG: UvrD-helicase domain-containing protein, partial [Mailhella sp.]|nr:UvrD-helicase domain-containing protein [Mailhella sp.]